MGKVLFLLFLILELPLARHTRGLNTQEQARPGAAVAGRWLVSADFYGTLVDLSMELKQDGDMLMGNFQGAIGRNGRDGCKIVFEGKKKILANRLNDAVALM